MNDANTNVECHLKMRFLLLITTLLLLLSNCNSPTRKVNPISSDTLASKVKHETPYISLKDTEFVNKNFVVFLRPDSTRFENYLKDGEEIYEVDSDFGFAINGAIDSISKNPKYKNILTTVTEKRFIYITDCKSCPLVIDRDTISYGLLFTKAGKDILLHETYIYSSEAFLLAISEYFKLKE